MSRHQAAGTLRSSDIAPAAAARGQKLPGAPSLLLDLIRFLAALVVAIAHITQPFFGNGPGTISIYGTSVIAVFFVLSGFVIRYVTRDHERNLRRYTIDRASRIYSVALPALILTAICDSISSKINPLFYFSNWGSTIGHPGVRFLLNLTFLSQSWFHDLPFLSNNPYWCLPDECIFYAAYGAAFFLKGNARWFALALIVLLVGPSVFLLLPMWLLGVLAYDIYAARRFTLKTTLQFVALSAAATVISIGALHNLRHPNTLQWMGRARYVPSLVAIPAALFMITGCWLVNDVKINEAHWLVRSARRVSFSTYTLYLIHFPLMVLAAALIPYNHSSRLAQLAIVTAIVLVSVLLSGWFDKLKSIMRRAFSSWWPEQSFPHRAFPLRTENAR